MIKRREFLKTASVAIGGATLLSSCTFGSQQQKTGLGLYTVRDGMVKDPDATLEAVAKMGFNWIEAGTDSECRFYNIKPKDFKNKIESFGMKFISSHNTLTPENTDRMLDGLAEGGLKYAVLRSIPEAWVESIDDYKKTADFFNQTGEKCKKLGMKFCFHNHWTEFVKVDGEVPYDVLLSHTDPDLVAFEMDLCWTTEAGVNPVEYFNRFPGRFELFHMKDITADKQVATLGEGIIDFKPIFASIEKGGLKYFFVEQDVCKTHTQLESARISRDFLINNL
ncbi:sugar phosphate isomerase/epimerase family protein [Sunxiuqinia sp. A32]|uniref:sugar phosphate isomerase/epimerase family protein n=1 Tax=Sunxiuqinia sp. A32 TaxID=3461496 RepID=UPI0040457E10